MTLLVADRTTTDLPFPVVRWLEVAWPDGLDRVETLALSGPVRIRRGRVVLHGDSTMRFRLGHGYVSDIRVGLGPLTARRGLDALVDGRGITVVGAEASVGPEIDQATFIALWCESLLFPTSWEALPGLRWTAVSDEEAIAWLPRSGGAETAVLRFDPDGPAFPVSFEAERFRTVGGPKVSWRAEYGEWHWRDGIALPTLMRIQWLDQPQPWLEMRVESVGVNEPVHMHEARAREAILVASAGR